MSKPQRTGGEILVDALRAQGVDRAFCVPGESYLAVLDALYDVRDEIDLVVCRQEGGAANMAEAYGKLTGRPGICFVTRGPGATNASIGVHTAFQDSTPMILFVGQVGRPMKDREGFQEVDMTAMFGPLAKWSAEIADARRIPEYVHRAFQVAMSGRPGPVVLALPEDMLSEAVEAPAPPRRAKRVAAAPTPAAIEQLRQVLAAAERPLAIVGGGWSAEASRDLATFAAAWNLPVAASLRCQDYLDNRHPNYVGHLTIGTEPTLAARLKSADVVLAIGPRLGEMTTAGYSLLEAPHPKQQLVHIHADPNELGRVYQAALMINAGGPEMMAALAGLRPSNPVPRGNWSAAAREDYEGSLNPLPAPGEMSFAEAIRHMRVVLPADAIICSGAGNYTAWVHKYWPFVSYRSQLAPTSGAMGYGVPSAVAAGLTMPGRTVVSFNGDGCFLMNGQEIATAAQYGAKVLFVVVNNGIYGTIRAHQERHYPTRVHGTNLRNPNFAEYASAFGLHGEQVRRTEDFPAALQRALAAPGSALLELIVDPEALAVRSTLSAIRDKALADRG